ncbi:MAG: hypothetical protein PHN69_08340 [Candidatus Pacebacteria bacterium]|nr:hypothetical protein [Candidatus Paceibacterota bacterium]
MGIDIKKESCSCSGGDCDCENSCSGCKCTVTLGSDSSIKDKDDFQIFIGHLSNITWMLFLIVFIFSSNTFLIVELLVAAIIFEEFD